MYYTYGGRVWEYNSLTGRLSHGNGPELEVLVVDQWDNGLPKIGSAYGIPCNSKGEVFKQADVPGAKKFDGDKPMLDLLIDGCPDALLGVAATLTYGYKKYGGKHGWKSLPDAKARYTAAMLRHQLAIAAGELNDPESGLPHADHVACNALFLAQLSKEGKCN